MKQVVLWFSQSSFILGSGNRSKSTKNSPEDDVLREGGTAPQTAPLSGNPPSGPDHGKTATGVRCDNPGDFLLPGGGTRKKDSKMFFDANRGKISFDDISVGDEPILYDSDTFVVRHTEASTRMPVRVDATLTDQGINDPVIVTLDGNKIWYDNLGGRQGLIPKQPKFSLSVRPCPPFMHGAEQINLVLGFFVNAWDH